MVSLLNIEWSSYVYRGLSRLTIELLTFNYSANCGAHRDKRKLTHAQLWVEGYDWGYEFDCASCMHQFSRVCTREVPSTRLDSFWPKFAIN